MLIFAKRYLRILILIKSAYFFYAVSAFSFMGKLF